LSKLTAANAACFKKSATIGAICGYCLSGRRLLPASWGLWQLRFSPVAQLHKAIHGQMSLCEVDCIPGKMRGEGFYGGIG